MEELLIQLEKQIKTLIEKHEHLKQSNQDLTQGKFHLVRENEKLLGCQEKAVSQIQSLVSKLKAIEKIS